MMPTHSCDQLVRFPRSSEDADSFNHHFEPSVYFLDTFFRSKKKHVQAFMSPPWLGRGATRGHLRAVRWAGVRQPSRLLLLLPRGDGRRRHLLHQPPHVCLILFNYLKVESKKTAAVGVKIHTPSHNNKNKHNNNLRMCASV